MSSRLFGVGLGLLTALLVVVLLAGAAAAQEEPEAGTRKQFVSSKYLAGKGFEWTTRDGEYSLRAGGRFQFHLMVDDYDHLRGKNNNIEFGVPRAYLFFSGHATEEFKYTIEYRIDNGVFEDCALIWTPKEMQDKVSDLKLDITMGHFKPKFSREYLTSSGSLSLVNRNQVDSNFRLERDYGINLTGKLFKNRLKLDLGFFNGIGDELVADNTRLRTTVRAQLDLNDPPTTQGDPKRSEKPRFSIGAAYSFENDVYDWDLNGLYDDNTSRWTADLAIYYQGLNVICAHFQRMLENYDTTGPADPYEKNLLMRGYSIQGSYFLLPKKLELVGLMSYLEPDIRNSHAWQHETRCGISYYLKGHALKIQADYGTLRERLTQGSFNDCQVRVQLTVAF